MITPTIWKSPFQVNTVNGTTYYDTVAAAADGTFYEAWSNSSFVAIGQHLDAYGSALGSNVNLVPATTFENHLAILPNGAVYDAFTFVSGSVDNTFIGRYSSSLGFSGYSTLNNSATINTFQPTVTAFADNSAYAVFVQENTASDWSIVGETVSSSGVVGSPQTLFDVGTQASDPHLATLDNGNAVVTYENPYLGSSTDHDIRFQILSENGTVLKSDTAVNGAFTSAFDTSAQVSALHTGGFVVVWTTTTGPSATDDIHAAIYDQSGNVVRDDFVVNTTTAGIQDFAHVNSLNDGNFLVTWRDEPTGLEHAQEFDSSGNHVGQEVAIGPNSENAAATLADGRTVLSFNLAAGNVDDEILDTRSNVTDHVTGHDLFGNGSADQLILRDSSVSDSISSTGGQLTMYALSPTTGLTQIGLVGADWSVAAAGDFNGDGRSDILMQHDNNGLRDLYSFTMGASQVTAITKFGTVGLDWQVDGTGDFNGDGYKDVLLERVNNGAKELDILGVTNGAVTSISVAGVLTPSSYQVDGIGDFNNDGKDDILVHYQDASGLHFLELNEANNTTQSIKAVANIGPEWQADGVGDFNGDGYADVLIQSDSASSRELGLLVNQGGNGFVFKDLGPIGKNVQIDGIGDFNHDGTADISAHYDPTGTSRVNIDLEMHNATVTAVHTTGTVGHEWIVT
jgi:hypothetical protein